MPLIIAGQEEKVAQQVNRAITRVIIQDDVSRIHMQAADAATLGIFQGTSGWTESASDDPSWYHLKWSFSP